MAIRKARFPSAYKEVEYIESTGTQYIDSGYMTSLDIEINADISIMEQPYKYKKIAGNSATWLMTLLIDGAGGRWVASTTSMYLFNYNIGIKFNIKAGASYCEVDGVNISMSADANPVSFGNFLIGSNMYGMGYDNANTRFYHFQIYDNSALVRDFIPCYRVADNEIGLYDMVNGVFYTNAGSGTFLKGNDVLPKIVKLYKGSTQIVKRYKGTQLIFNALPSAFQEVEYIESDGNQYIDSGYRLTTNNIRYKMKFQPTSVYAWASFIGAAGGVDRASLRTHRLTLNFYIALGTTEDAVGNTLIANTNYDVDLVSNNGNYSFSVNETTYTGTFTGDTLKTQNVLIFSMNNEHGRSDTPCSIKLYFCQIYDNDVLVRNFVPCYRKSDNVAGLYDLVNGVFYTNAGTGTFIVGGNV